ncbi:glycosyltransferase [Paenibacillus popilliae]|uniref:Glycosyltransferase n=1 Tax=Paenibacillus popilliae ATCC 14706 TaxID=1212764 RepID=M9LLE4_PAEPP|nr:glycosyltransferase [Paenibacillus popilliae]GAC44150.1 glycosyltransferase [Paenibacillus popilliae ATCC 14706]
MQPKVTIIIPFYNDPYVEQAITSALNQTFPNIEIIVVDDGSTRHTDKIQSYTNRILYLGKANGGTATALNCGIRAASGEYIAWLSSDDIFYPHKLAIQIPYMLERRASICYTSFDYINDHGQVIEHNVGPHIPNMKSFYQSMLAGNPINGCTVVARKDLLLQTGLFNEALPFAHDYDLWLRLITSRIDFHYLNQPLIQYRRHEQMGTVKHRTVIEQETRIIQSRYAHLLRVLYQELGGENEL